MLRLYDYLRSGNGYKVRLLLHQLGIPFERVECDIDEGRDAHAGVPATQPERPDPGAGARRRHAAWPNRTRSSGTSRRARRSCPPTRLARAQVLQWMFFEQYSHEPYIAVGALWLPYAS